MLLALALGAFACAQPAPAAAEAPTTEPDTDHQIDQLEGLLRAVELAHPVAAQAVHHELCEEKCHAQLSAITDESTGETLVSCVEMAAADEVDVTDPVQLLDHLRGLFAEDLGVHTDAFWHARFPVARLAQDQQEHDSGVLEEASGDPPEAIELVDRDIDE